MRNLTPTPYARPGLVERAVRVDEQRRRGKGLRVGPLLATALLVVAPIGWAQQQQPPKSAPAQAAPSPADLEPGVNTSAPPPPDTSPPAAAPAPAAPAGAPAGKAGASSSASVSSKASASSKNDMASKTDTAAAGSDKGGRKGGAKAEDHLQLDTTQITGNQELPKVLYIVPWKRSDLGDLLGKPANSLLDEVLQPVDRDVFRRENRYYDALKPDAGSGAGKAGAAAGQTSGDKH